MEERIRCQSCGMPISAEFNNLGTEQDGSSSDTYCSFCYQKGSFVDPDQTVDEMIQSSIHNMTGELGMPLDQSTELANSFIPTLGRWKNKE